LEINIPQADLYVKLLMKRYTSLSGFSRLSRLFGLSGRLGLFRLER